MLRAGMAGKPSPLRVRAGSVLHCEDVPSHPALSGMSGAHTNKQTTSSLKAYSSALPRLCVFVRATPRGVRRRARTAMLRPHLPTAAATSSAADVPCVFLLATQLCAVLYWRCVYRTDEQGTYQPCSSSAYSGYTAYCGAEEVALGSAATLHAAGAGARGDRPEPRDNDSRRAYLLVSAKAGNFIAANFSAASNGFRELGW
eukprot:6211116-Pleurochrysis_carterae.AAC.3